MTYLAVVGRHRRGVHDRAALAVVVEGRRLTHRGRCQPDAVEGPDQVDRHDLREDVETVRRGVLAVLADCALWPADSGAVHQYAQRAELFRGVDCGDHVVLRRHVGVGEDAFDLLGHGFALVILKVGDDDPCALLRQQPCRCLAQSRRAAGDDCRCSVDVHRDDGSERDKGAAKRRPLHRKRGVRSLGRWVCPAAHLRRRWIRRTGRSLQLLH